MFDKLLEITDNKELLGLNDELKGLYINNYFNKYKGQVVFVVNSIYEANIFYQIILLDSFLKSENGNHKKSGTIKRKSLSNTIQFQANRTK